MDNLFNHRQLPQLQLSDLTEDLNLKKQICSLLLFYSEDDESQYYYDMFKSAFEKTLGYLFMTIKVTPQLKENLFKLMDELNYKNDIPIIIEYINGIPVSIFTDILDEKTLIEYATRSCCYQNSRT